MGTPLLLTESEVPVGTRVHIHLPGQDEPDRVEGSLVVFDVLYGGVPLRRKFYEIPGGIRIGEGGVLIGTSLEGFVEGIRFSPVEIFTPEDAPTNRRYAVFQNGQRLMMKRGSWTESYEVVKGYEGEFVLSHVFPFQALVHNSAFTVQMLRFQQIPEEELLRRLGAYEERRTVYAKHDLDKSFESDIRQEEAENRLVVEALARRYRQNAPSDLVRVLKSIDTAGTRYLCEIPLPPDAQLVPVGR